jgi:ATP-dependent Lhr-like helicase
MLFIGPEAERRFGHRHFMNLTAVFTAAPEFTVLNGRTEIGRTDPTLLTEQCAGPRRLLLAGRSWQVTYIDWHRNRCFVEPVDGGGKAKWNSGGLPMASFDLARAAREVLLGQDPPVALTKCAEGALAQPREESAETVHPGGNLIIRDGAGKDLQWWTWAGHRTNLTLAATLSGIADPLQRGDDLYVRLRSDLTPQMWKEATVDAADRLCLPEVDPRALNGLKFSAALPQRLAEATLAARLADLDHAAQVLTEPARFVDFRV